MTLPAPKVAPRIFVAIRGDARPLYTSPAFKKRTKGEHDNNSPRIKKNPEHAIKNSKEDFHSFPASSPFKHIILR